MIFLGYIFSIFIGISLGLMGGGGSILTVPVLVYLFNINPVLATTYSLFIVGMGSMFGVYAYLKQKLVNLGAVLNFGVPSVIAIFITRKFLLPHIPSVLFTVEGFAITRELFLMLLFSVLMIGASYSMIRKRKTDLSLSGKPKPATMAFQGVIVGFLTGIVGVGGGFLIIPSLNILGKLSMKEAIGTSLAIIVLNSLVGFAGSLGHFTPDWAFLLSVTAVAVTGIFIGTQLSKKIEGTKLKPAFGWFILCMGIYIIAKETLLK